MRKKCRNRSTPFDDAFKTIQERMPPLMIPVVNEAFGTRYDLFAEELSLLRNEFQTPNGKRYEDSRFLLDGMKYHFECQSTPDGKISLRVVEYDFADTVSEAYAEVRQSKSRPYSLALSRSGVLWLRESKGQRQETVSLVGPDLRTLKIKIPNIYVLSYSLDDILEKKLFLFLPFYMMRYEEQIGKQANRDGLLQRIAQDHQIMQDGIYQFFHDTKLEYCINLLNDLIQTVMDALIPSDDDSFRNEVNKIMGGHSLTTPTTIILDQGIAQGRKEERVNTLRERKLKNAQKKRADMAIKRADTAAKRADKAERELALLREKYAQLQASQT